MTDFVVGTDGRLVSGVFLATYVIANRPQLGQVQIHQNAPGELLYKVARPRDHGSPEADWNYLREATRRYLGDAMHVDIESVDHIAAEASGKFIFCRSHVAHEHLAG